MLLGVEVYEKKGDLEKYRRMKGGCERRKRELIAEYFKQNKETLWSGINEDRKGGKSNDCICEKFEGGGVDSGK